MADVDTGAVANGPGGGYLSLVLSSLTSLFHKRSRGLLLGLASFLAGLGAGIVMEQYRVWHHQQGYFNELLRQVAILQTEVKQLRRQQQQQKRELQRHYSRAVLTTVDQERVDVTDLDQPRSNLRSALGSSAFFSAREFVDDYDSEEYEDELFEEALSELDSFYSGPNGTGDAEQIALVYAQLDSLLDSDEDARSEAYERCCALKETPRLRIDPEFQWRYSKSCHFKSAAARESGQKEEAKRLAFEAAEASEKALELRETCSAAHKWRAITVGLLGDYQGTQQKILNGYKFKEHIDRAIQLNPVDYAAHYLRGRWCWGVYNLSWLEKRAAAVLFTTPPSSTVEEALDCFMEVERLHPRQWIENLLYAAKCRLELRQTDEAVELLLAATRLPVRTTEDESAVREVVHLMRRCNVELPESSSVRISS